ncbi:transposase [Amycolatopsis sp. NPDC051371]|uniref:IS110 family transposase n=1 Tax=Amycolatopsis sp. NPDC051371 TaxID=3155800 RepID=UPI003435D40A
MRRDLTPITSPEEIVADLQVLTARREDLMADWVRGINRIRELLASIFPALERAFDYSTRSGLILLTGSKPRPASALPKQPVCRPIWPSMAPGPRQSRPWWTRPRQPRRSRPWRCRASR